MNPLKRKGVNKRAAAGKFRRDSTRTKRLNIAAPMRGGIRL